MGAYLLFRSIGMKLYRLYIAGWHRVAKDRKLSPFVVVLDAAFKGILNETFNCTLLSRDRTPTTPHPEEKEA